MRAPTPIAAAISRHTAIGRRRLLAGEHDAERLVLVGQLAGSRRVDVADLEQRDAGAAVRLVEGDGPQQARPQRRAQHALLGDERVGDAQGVAVEAGRARACPGPGTGSASPR